MPKLTASNEVQADRLVGLSERARTVGRTGQADHFLLLAWTAFDGGELSVRRCASRQDQAKSARYCN